jgi:hypothetical protein
MKILATNLIDFNTWYRYGYKSFSTGLIIDLDDQKLLNNTEELYNKVGFFEEESDVFFVEIDENIDDFKNRELFTLPINKLKNIYPLSERGQKYLSNKLTDFKIEQPIPKEFSRVILEQRNHYLAKKGGEMVVNSFLSDFDLILSKVGLDIKPYFLEFIKALDKYSNNLDFKPDNLLEHMIVYERSRPYPTTDDGYLYDVGSIAKSFFCVTDEDLKNRNQLQYDDRYKFERIEEMLSLSLFLQKNNDKSVFTAFTKEYENSDNLKKLNFNLSFFNELYKDCQINNIVVLAFYLKFRYLVRNTSNILDIHFYNEIKRFILKRPLESIIALYMNGLFFGFMKFRELYYLLNPLTFSKTHNSNKEKFKKIALGEIITVSDPLTDNGLKTEEEKNSMLNEDTDSDSQDPSFQLQQIFIEAVTKAGEKGIKFSEIQKIIKEKIGLDLDKKKVEALSESSEKFEKIIINNAKNINGIKIKL